jgi:PEP-CTERM motif
MKEAHRAPIFLACCLASLASVTVAQASSIPFDIANATPRPVQVWSDLNPDPAVYHGSMVPAVVGSWSSDGVTGTVRVAASVMESYIAAEVAQPVPGSISDLTITIDLASRDVTRIQFSGKLTNTEIGDVTFEYAMQSTPGPWTLPSGLVIPGTIGGFQDVPGLILSPVFASDSFRPNGPGTDYTVVPTRPYDPTTGYITAVGPNNTDSTALGHVVQFDKSVGDIQLTEAVPEPTSIVLLSLGIFTAMLFRGRRRPIRHARIHGNAKRRSSQRMLVLSSAVLLATVVPAEAGTIVVNFDDLIGQELVPDGYGGIAWGDSWTYFSFPQPPYNPHSGTVRIYNGYPNSETYIHDDSFSFASPVRFDGAWFAGGGYPPTAVRFDLYKSGALVHSSDFLEPSDIPTFLASGYSGLIDTVVVHDVNPDNDDYVMDDVTYTTAAVPEPTSFTGCCVGMGLCFVFWWRRRSGSAG